ncbi:MAG: hypothetical protein Q7S92_03350 [Candidatus Diapherotrites archaeon]|nr:hypothetical protein [Candidatus Diapherotrites archaeon]
MQIIEVFTDSEKRKCAIIQTGKTKVLVWKSLSKSQWFAAPFAVDVLANYWIAKTTDLVRDAILPTKLVTALNARTGIQLDIPRTKALLEQHGLLQKRDDVQSTLGRLETYFANLGHPIDEAKRAAREHLNEVIGENYRKQIDEFYSRWKKMRTQTRPRRPARPLTRLGLKKPKPKNKRLRLL